MIDTIWDKLIDHIQTNQKRVFTVSVLLCGVTSVAK